MLDFLNLSILDAIDILLVAILLYYVYKLLRGSVAINIFIGIAILVIIWNITVALKMQMLSKILGTLLGGGAIAIIIVFQQEIRKFLLMIGTTNITNKRSFIRQIKFLKSEINQEFDIPLLISFCNKMSISKTGVIIVIKRTNSLDFIKSTGDTMKIEANGPILESIFYKNSPLHDGALVLEGKTITATRVILPLSKKDLPSRFGLRHRAAIGITEKTDALCILVSEETGKIMYIKDGEFVLYDTMEQLTETIEYDVNI